MNIVRNSYPVVHALYIVFGCLLTILNIYLTLNSYYDISTKFVVALLCVNVWLLIEFPCRKVRIVSIDPSSESLTIEYEVMVFFICIVEIDYSDLQFLAYSLQSQLDRINHKDDIATIRFYEKRTYVAKITQGIDGWTQDDINIIFQEILTKGKRLQVSPGLI